MGHEIHQYFFERFLRDEMSTADKMAFEEKLSADPALRASFLHYKHNREKYLSDLVAVQRKKSQHRQLNRWIYVLISCIGILISINFYLEKTDLRNRLQQANKDSVPLFRRIPLLFSFPSETKPRASASNPSETNQTQKLFNKDTLLTGETKEDTISFDHDVLLLDTVIPAFTQMVFEKEYAFAQKLLDSTATDQMVEQLTVHNLLKSEQAKKHVFEVEFWNSPIGYFGYKFNGKKLQVYGFDTTNRLTLIKTEHQLMLRRDEGNLYPLYNDDNFHKF